MSRVFHPSRFFFFLVMMCFNASLFAGERVVTTEKGSQIILRGPNTEALKVKARYLRQLFELLEQQEFSWKGPLKVAPRPKMLNQLPDHTLYLPEKILNGKDNIFLFLCQSIWFLLDQQTPCEMEFRNAIAGYLALLVIELADGKQNEIKVQRQLSTRLQEMMQTDPQNPDIRFLHRILALKLLEHKVSKGWMLYTINKMFKLKGRIGIQDYLKILSQETAQEYHWWLDDWWKKQELCRLQSAVEILDYKNKLARVVITQKSGQELRFPVDITLSGSAEPRFIPEFFVDSAFAEWRGKYNFLPKEVRLNDNLRHPLIYTEPDQPYFFQEDAIRLDPLGMNFRAPQNWKLYDLFREGRSIQVFASNERLPNVYLYFVAWESNNNQTLFQVSEEEFNQHYYFETHIESQSIRLGDQTCELRVADEYVLSGHSRSLHVFSQRGQAFLHFWADAKGKDIETVTQGFREFVEKIELYSPPTLYEQKEPPVPLSYRVGTFGRAILLVDASQVQTEHFPLIPLTCKINQGKPMILFHQGKLTSEQIRLINRYRPANCYTLGRVPENVASRSERLPPYSQFYPIESEAVVCTPDRPALIAGTLLASRKQLPLVIWDAQSPQGFQQISYQGKLYLVGSFEALKQNEKTWPANRIAQSQTASETLKSLTSSYLVVVNQNESHGKEDFFFATQLAAFRQGSVLPLDLQLEQYSFKLNSSDWIPEHLKKNKKIEVVMVGEGELPDEKGTLHALKFMLPAIGEEQMNMASSTMSSKVYGEPYICKSDEGSFKENNLVPICSPLSIGTKEYWVTTRMKTIVGGLVYGQETENLILFSSPSPEIIRSHIVEYVQNTQIPKHLAIVGSPQRFPFYYQASALYRDNGLTQSELPTDLLYGNLNWDAFQEIAVGRLFTESPAEDSFLMTNIMAYEPSPKPVGLMLCPGFPDEDSRTQFTTVFPGTEFAFQEMEKELSFQGYTIKSLLRRDCTLDQVVPEMPDKDLIFYTNHANQESWTFGPKKMITNFRSTLFKNPPPGTQVLPALRSNPFVYSGGCLSAGLDLGFPRDKMFPLVMLDKGAIGFIGNTRFGVGDSGDHIMKEFLNQAFYKKATVGEALKEAKNNLLMYIQNPHLGKRSNLIQFRYAYLEEFYILNLFGDPAVSLSRPKETLPSYQVTYQHTDSTLQIKVTFDENKIWTDRVLFPDDGKENEVEVWGAPGLFLSNFPRILSQLDLPPSILPGVFLRIPLDTPATQQKIKLLKGPRWVLGHSFLSEKDLLLQIHLLRFIPEIEHQGGSREVAKEVEIQIEFTR